MFYTAKIQDGRKKWQEIDFWEKSPVESADTRWVKNFNEITLSHTVSEINVFYAENQEGHQKWQETDFWEKSPVGSVDTLGVKNLDKIALSRTVSKINVFLHFTQKVAKNGGKTIFGKSRQLTLLIPWG